MCRQLTEDYEHVSCNHKQYNLFIFYHSLYALLYQSPAMVYCRCFELIALVYVICLQDKLS